MKIGYVILLLLAAVLILSGAVTLIYLAGYKRYLSKRIADGINTQVGRKKRPAPFSVFLFSAAVLTVVSGFILVSADLSLEKRNEPEQFFASFSRCRPNGLIGELSYDDQIAGYTRQAAEDGGFSFVYYTKNDASEPFPTLLLYVDTVERYEYQYIIADKSGEYAEISDTEANAQSGWYALTENDFCGTLTFSCESSSGRGEISIDIGD